MDQPKSRAKIQPFIDTFDVDVDEFAQPTDSFQTFNQFFYRSLKPAARPIQADAQVAIFPADGRHLVIENLSSADTFYAKGQSFNLKSFLGDDDLAQEFTGGALLISRLCPVDYHRFHFPVAGQASAPTRLLGTLRSVSPLALRRQLSILWQNRRERTAVESSEFGKVIVTEVGATCVGGIHQTFESGFVQKGDEKGYFSFGGSNVTTLFSKGAIQFDDDLLHHSKNGIEVYAKMGQQCGIATSTDSTFR